MSQQSPVPLPEPGDDGPADTAPPLRLVTGEDLPARPDTAGASRSARALGVVLWLVGAGLLTLLLIGWWQAYRMV
jgi:hypothetical protein